MGSQPRELQPNDISLFKSLGIDFFEGLLYLRPTSLACCFSRCTKTHISNTVCKLSRALIYERTNVVFLYLQGKWSWPEPYRWPEPHPRTGTWWQEGLHTYDALVRDQG